MRKYEKALQYILRERLIKQHTKTESICEYKASKPFLFSNHVLVSVGQTLSSLLQTAMFSSASLAEYLPRVSQWSYSDLFS